MKTRKLFYVVFICLTAVSVISCKSGHNSHQGKTKGCGTSQTALDWSGVYTSVLPCADCEGVQTTVVLNSDNTFELRTKYLGRSFEEVFHQGEFVWNEAGSIITLLGIDETSMPTQFWVGENRLFQLDMDGNRFPSDVEPRYTLEKVSNLIGKRWKLIELNSNEVPEFKDKSRQPYFTLSVENSSVNGHAGCNRFHGTYVIQSGNRIRFSQMVATQMFCLDNMETEAQFMRVFEMTDNYTISGDTLSLNRARMAPLARFAAIDE